MPWKTMSPLRQRSVEMGRMPQGKAEIARRSMLRSRVPHVCGDVASGSNATRVTIARGGWRCLWVQG